MAVVRLPSGVKRHLMNINDYDAIRRTAAMVARSGRGLIAVAGTDRRTYLHALLTNDIAALAPGTGCYAAWLTPQGRFITDLSVHELGDLLLLDVHESVKDDVLARLDQFIFSEDVKLGDVTGTFASIGVHGPGAAHDLASALGDTAGRLDAFVPYQNARLPFDGDSVVVVRDDELGVKGFTVYVDATRREGLMRVVADAGARVIPADVADVVRIESGRPAFGVDIDEQTIPLEAGVEQRAISFTKGCYPGQEVIIRVLHRGGGRVAKRLVGLALEGARVPSAGAVLVAGEREVGHVTSAAHSPALDRPIALGYVHRDLVEPGTQLDVLIAEERTPAVVMALPFVAR